MPPHILVCGSLAIDQLLRFKGSFAQYQTDYQVEALNASLPIHEYRTCFGGCGGNISFGIAMLGLPVTLLSHAGLDFETDYRGHLSAHGVNCDSVAIANDSPFSARCTIISDDHGNQITGFYPGDATAADRKRPSQLPNIEDISLAILGPEEPSLMMRQAHDLAELKLPFIFDPGQWVSEFSKADLLAAMALATYTIGNAHEISVITATLGLEVSELNQIATQLLITRGAEGVDLFLDGQPQRVPAVKTAEINDATGTGDAFRAGLIYGLAQGLDLERAATLGCKVAHAALQSKSPQDYVIDRQGLVL